MESILVATCALESLFSQSAEDILDFPETAAVFRVIGCLNRWNIDLRSNASVDFRLIAGQGKASIG